MRKGFTLIELLVVIAIIAILSVVVIFALNPVVLLEQGRDSSRMSDMAVLNNNINFASEVGSGGGISLGSPDTVYISIPDPVATSTAGDQCQGLGLGTLPSGWAYHCAASSTYHNVNGTGWVPINFTILPGGSPSGALPVDPVNQTSTFLYYTYVMNSSYQYQLYAHFESPSYQAQESTEGTPGIDPETYKIGTNVDIAPFAGGMAGYWPFTEGNGATTGDLSGYGNTGTLTNVSWITGTHGAALSFNGNNSIVTLSNADVIGSGPFTFIAWVNATTSPDLEILFTTGYTGCTIVAAWAPGANFDCTNTNYANVATAGSNGSYTSYLGHWTQVAAVRNINGAYTLYINGSQVGFANQNAGPVTGGGGYTVIGCGGYSPPCAPNGDFSGEMNDIFLYSRPLSATEIAAIYNATQ